MKVSELTTKDVVSKNIQDKRNQNETNPVSKIEKTIPKTLLITQAPDDTKAGEETLQQAPDTKARSEAILNDKKHQRDIEAFDPLDLSNTEIDVLQNLRERRLEIEQRTRNIEARENQLKVVEERVDEKIRDLRKLEARVNSLLSKYDSEQIRKKKNLIRIYENMKPQDAARILQQLNLSILLDVVEMMSQRKIAPILAKMDPVKAKIITEQLAKRYEDKSSNIVSPKL